MRTEMADVDECINMPDGNWLFGTLSRDWTIYWPRKIRRVSSNDDSLAAPLCATCSCSVFTRPCFCDMACVTTPWQFYPLATTGTRLGQDCSYHSPILSAPASPCGVQIAMDVIQPDRRRKCSTCVEDFHKVEIISGTAGIQAQLLAAEIVELSRGGRG